MNNNTMTVTLKRGIDAATELLRAEGAPCFLCGARNDVRGHFAFAPSLTIAPAPIRVITVVVCVSCFRRPKARERAVQALRKSGVGAPGSIVVEVQR